MRHRFVSLALLAVGLAGCAAEKPSNASGYFNLAALNLRQGAYNQAVENYRTMLDEYPFSEYSEEAELKIGIAQYKNGSCPEATAAFTDFQRRHPTSPYLPLVGYMLGECAEEQMRPSDRDQSAAQNAHAYYQALMQQHPTSPYAELARQKLERCRETLADHELVVAEFYTIHKNHKAAETRLMDLINRFNDTDVAGTALFQLGELYRKDEQPEKAILAFAAVEYYHPTHDDAPRAKEELTELLDGAAPPSGDPLAVLKSETGRTRTIAIAQTARPLQDSKRRGGAPAQSPTGFGLPGGSGPFGRGGTGGIGGPGRY